MNPLVELGVAAVFMGLAGAGLMDIWGFVLRRAFNVSTLDYALLGRWIGNFPRGRFVHQRIASADPVRGERALGWFAHYAIGVAFAVPLLVIWGQDWVHNPTILPAMLVGLGTIVAPWFVMQPAMGMGIAASRSADPRAARLRNVGTHAVYGIGLYASALILSAIQL